MRVHIKPIHSELILRAIVKVGFIGILSVMVALIVDELTGLADQNRLISVSIVDILSVIPLAAGLYFIGAAIAMRFPLRQAVGWFSLFFMVRILTAIVLSHIFMYDDEIGFHYAALALSKESNFFDAGWAYYGLVTWIYSLFGANILIPKAVNVLFGSLLPFLAFAIATELYGDRRYARRAFWIIGLTPPFVIFSGVNLKEILTAFAILWVAWSLTLSRKRPMAGLIGALIGVGGLYWVRGAPLALIGMLGMVLRYSWPGLHFSGRLRWQALGALLFSLTIVAILASRLLGLISATIVSRTTAEEYYIKRFVESQALVTKFLDIDSPLSPKNIGILFLRGLYSPSPLRWMLDRGIDTLVEGVSMALWYAVFPLSVITLCRFWRRLEIAILGVMGLALLAIATVGIAVGSDPFRHRIMSMALFTILASASMSREMVRGYRWVLWLWGIGVSGFTGLWLWLRL